MTELKDFLMEFGGHANRYTSYMLIGKDINAQKVLDVLMELDPEMCVGSGYETASKKEGHTVVGFEICKSTVELNDITKKLNCIGYADEDWDCNWFEASENGSSMDNFIAKWDEGMPYVREDDGDDCFDAFFTVTDGTTGDEFHSGAGCVDESTKAMFTGIVKLHQELPKKEEAAAKARVEISLEDNAGATVSKAWFDAFKETDVEAYFEEPNDDGVFENDHIFLAALNDAINSDIKSSYDEELDIIIDDMKSLLKEAADSSCEGLTFTIKVVEEVFMDERACFEIYVNDELYSNYVDSNEVMTVIHAYANGWKDALGRKTA